MALNLNGWKKIFRNFNYWIQHVYRLIPLARQTVI